MPTSQCRIAVRQSAGARQVVILLALILQALGCASRPAVPLQPGEIEQFQQHVTALADPIMEGRGPGTAGLDRARDYLIQHFHAAGLAPAFGDQYTQTLSIDTGVQATTQSLAVIDTQGRVLRQAQPEKDVSAMGYSASAAFEGGVVFVGYGIAAEEHHYNSYRTLDSAQIAGRAVLTFRFEPQDEQARSRWTKETDIWTSSSNLFNKAKWAANQGAAALIVVTPPTQESSRHGMLRPAAYTASGSTPAPIPILHASAAWVSDLLAQANRQWTLTSLQQAADKDDRTAFVLDGVHLRGEVQLERGSAVIANVAGIIPGRGDLSREVVVVGAHYDHLGHGEFGSLAQGPAVHPGADDNASGTAALLLIGRRWSDRVENDGDRPRRALLVIAFSGEERGLLGSRHFLDHIGDTDLNVDHIVAMINMDMIGRMKKNLLFTLGLGSGDGWTAIVRRAVREAGLRYQSDLSAAFTGASDHASFYLHRIPAIHLFTGVHEDYHRPSDTAEKINAAGGVAVVNVVDRLLEHLLHERKRLTFNSEGAAIPHAGRMAGHGALLGVVPDYVTLEGAAGCRLAGVTPGTPAAAAGLRAGDVIVQWNETAIGNVQDLTLALGRSKPGDLVRLAIRRDGHRQEIAVTLGQR